MSNEKKEAIGIFVMFVIFFLNCLIPDIRLFLLPLIFFNTVFFLMD